jgi:hypothetical protein
MPCDIVNCGGLFKFVSSKGDGGTLDPTLGKRFGAWKCLVCPTNRDYRNSIDFSFFACSFIFIFLVLLDSKL